MPKTKFNLDLTFSSEFCLEETIEVSRFLIEEIVRVAKLQDKAELTDIDFFYSVKEMDHE